jgi:hypothetical protein
MDEGMGEWGSANVGFDPAFVIPSERAVIPSERSESRDLHFGSALFTGRNADFPGCTGHGRICSMGAERSLLHTIEES